MTLDEGSVGYALSSPRNFAILLRKHSLGEFADHCTTTEEENQLQALALEFVLDYLKKNDQGFVRFLDEQADLVP